MTPLDSIDVVCPLCGGKFSYPDNTASERVPCPHCGGKVKVAGRSTTQSDDNEWLRLDDDVFPQSADERSQPTHKTPVGKNKESGVVQPSKDSFSDDSSLDEFQIPDLPPLSDLPIPIPGPMPAVVPPLSEADLEALSGFSTNDDQTPAPVKVVRTVSTDDSFRVKCPICESLTYAKINQVGKKIRCGDCHSTIVVPPPPKVKTKYQPDIESAKAYTFQDSDNSGDHPKPADPFRKSADEYLRSAEAAVVEKADDDDWTVPSIKDWAINVVGIFRDPSVIGYWVFLSALAAIPACIAIQFSSSIILMGMFAGGILFAGLLVAHGFAILQSVANGEKEVTEWPVVDFWAWIGPLFVAASAIGVSAGPAWLLGQYFFGVSLTTVAMAMMSLYVLYPFVLLSMLDEESVLVPFSVEVSKSVTRSSEQWGGLYLSSGILFFLLFVVYLATAAMPSLFGVVVAIAATVATVFIYFALLGQLAFAIGHAVNAPPMVNDVVRKPKLPE